MSDNFDPIARRRELERRAAARDRLLLAGGLLSIVLLGVSLAALWETFR